MQAAASALSSFFYQIGNLSLFYYHSYRALFSRPMVEETLKQTYRIGVESLPIVISVTAFVGMNIVVQAYEMLKILGAQDMAGMFLSMAAVRELAPILAAALVGAKAGCSIASELATMRIREQIDALEVMSVNPYVYLVAPRLMGAIIMIPLISIVALVSCVGAGYIAAVYQFGLNGNAFLAQVFSTMGIVDLRNVMLKSLVFAGLVGPIVSYAGFYAAGGARGVGEATNRAVVWGAIAIVTCTAILTAFLY
jgi:phospholipid/cholesterol/gamma-HCH transport system permease protein